MSTPTTAPALPGTSIPAVDRDRAYGLSSLIRTPADPVVTVARFALGAMILPHGMQKLFGAFGGFGFTGTMEFFTETMGIPWVFALLAIVAEFFGGLGLLSGLLGRVAAFGVGAVMLVAVLTSHVQNGFFLNWFGTMPAGSEGWEFHLLAIALAVVVLLRGSGAWSLDRVLTARSRG